MSQSMKSLFLLIQCFILMLTKSKLFVLSDKMSCLSTLNCSHLSLMDVNSIFGQNSVWSLNDHHRKTLDLSHNMITKLDGTNIDSERQHVISQILKNVNILNLSYNNITSIRHVRKFLTSWLESSSANSAPLALELDLSFNRILTFSHLFENVVDSPTSVTVETSGVSALRKLNLKGNRIVSFEPGCFKNLESLTHLSLSNNRLSEISKGSFSNLHSLTTLNLNRNKINAIFGLTFHDGVENLKVLYLKKNKIRHLSDGAFFGMNNIEEIHLDKNKIEEVSQGAFYGVTSLRKLTLTSNRISMIAKECWEYCISLTHLNLESNRLQFIDNSTFNHLKSLTELSLTRNEISHIVTSSLDDNQHRAIRIRYDDPSTLLDTFSGCPNLTRLDLSHNFISQTIEDPSIASSSTPPFAGLVHLKYLSLSYNDIKSVSGAAFKGGLISLEELDLSGNPLTTLQSFDFSDILPELHIFRISSRFLICDCYIKWLPTQVNKFNITGMEKAKCGHPVSLKMLNMLSVDYKAFECDDFPKPYFTQHPMVLKSSDSPDLPKNVLIGIKDDTDFTVSCEASSTSSEPLKISWKVSDNANSKSAIHLTDFDSDFCRKWDENQIEKSIHSGIQCSTLEKRRIRRNHPQLLSDSYQYIGGGGGVDRSTSDISADYDTDYYYDDEYYDDEEYESGEDDFFGSYDDTSDSQEIRDAKNKEKSAKNQFGSSLHRNRGPQHDVMKHRPFPLQGSPIIPSIFTHSTPKTPPSMKTSQTQKINVPPEISIPPYCVTQTCFSYDGQGRHILSKLRFNHKLSSKLYAANYQCVASNQFGVSYSNVANLVVYVPPAFVHVPPLNLSVVISDDDERSSIDKERNMATLRCGAKGDPVPDVSWYKMNENGSAGGSFPAAEEGRLVMNVLSDSSDNLTLLNSFAMYNIQLKDEGVYVCKAKSEAGEVHTNVTLNVYQKPRFRKSMTGQQVDVGSTALLDCSSHGSPPPVTKWLRNGIPLGFSSVHIEETSKGSESHSISRSISDDFALRYFFTERDQLLAIANVKLEDGGRYECEISNELGSTRQFAYLTVALNREILSNNSSSGSISFQFDSESTRILLYVLASIVALVLTISIIVCVAVLRRSKGGASSSSSSLDSNGLTSSEIVKNGKAGHKDLLLSPRSSTALQDAEMLLDSKRLLHLKLLLSNPASSSGGCTSLTTDSSDILSSCSGVTYSTASSNKARSSRIHGHSEESVALQDLIKVGQSSLNSVCGETQDSIDRRLTRRNEWKNREQDQVYRNAESNQKMLTSTMCRPPAVIPRKSTTLRRGGVGNNHTANDDSDSYYENLSHLTLGNKEESIYSTLERKNQRQWCAQDNVKNTTDVPIRSSFRATSPMFSSQNDLSADNSSNKQQQYEQKLLEQSLIESAKEHCSLTKPNFNKRCKTPLGTRAQAPPTLPHIQHVNKYRTLQQQRRNAHAAKFRNSGLPLNNSSVGLGRSLLSLGGGNEVPYSSRSRRMSETCDGSPPVDIDSSVCDEPIYETKAIRCSRQDFD